MADKLFDTIVVLPDNTQVDVHYYYKSDKEKNIKLFIQLHDCICSIAIEPGDCNKPELLEKIVHNRVINTRGHLC